MKIEHMRYIIDLAKTGSFSKTAQNFFITQSTLSYTIQQIELEVGRNLFTRTAWRGVQLTSFGREFLLFCINVIEDYDNLVYRTDELELISLPDKIRIASCAALTSPIIKELNKYLEENFPTIELIVDTIEYSDIYEKVQNEYDFGIISVKKEELDTKMPVYISSTLSTILLYDNYVWCCSAKVYENVMANAQENILVSRELILKNMSSFVLSRDDFFQNPKLLEALCVLMDEGEAYVSLPQYIYWMLFDKEKYRILYKQEEKVFCHALLKKRNTVHPIYHLLEERILSIADNIKTQFTTTETSHG
ncbi:MAG: LysR family transcriptional regulator [Peptococcaceae bacterium]|nr:LysR family transcriptional regulator [Peptococcaceae bacterium]